MTCTGIICKLPPLEASDDACPTACVTSSRGTATTRPTRIRWVVKAEHALSLIHESCARCGGSAGAARSSKRSGQKEARAVSRPTGAEARVPEPGRPEAARFMRGHARLEVVTRPAAARSEPRSLPQPARGTLPAPMPCQTMPGCAKDWPDRRESTKGSSAYCQTSVRCAMGRKVAISC